MPKRIQVPAIKADDAVEADGTVMDRYEHLEITRHEHAVALAQAKLQVAQQCDRAVRMEIAQATRAVQDGLAAAQAELAQAIATQKAFAQALADRYHFDWKHYAYDNDTGVIRRVIED